MMKQIDAVIHSLSLSVYLSLRVFVFCYTLHYDYDYDLIKSLCVIMRVVLFFGRHTRRSFLRSSLAHSLALLAIHFVCLFPILSSCSYFSRFISSSIALVLFQNENKQTKNANAEENISFFRILLLNDYDCYYIIPCEVCCGCVFTMIKTFFRHSSVCKRFISKFHSFVFSQWLPFIISLGTVFVVRIFKIQQTLAKYATTTTTPNHSI